MTVSVVELELPLDIYLVQRRPGHAQLVVNDGYDGLLVLDPWRQEVLWRCPFPATYPRRGTIDSWCLRADGALAMVFQDDGTGGAALVPLDGGPAMAASHPSWGDTQAMPYDWRGEDLWLMDPEQFEFGVVRGADLSAFVPQDGHQVLTSNRSWRRALDRMRRAKGFCMRVEPDRGRMLWASPARDGGPAIGMVSWVDEAEVSVRLDAMPSRVAMASGCFVALYEYEVRVLAVDGTVIARHVPPPMHHFVAVDVLPHRDGRPESIALVAAAYDGRTSTTFRVVGAGDVG